MKTQIAKTRRCPACRKADLASAEYVREFRPHGKAVPVKLLTSRCPLCGAEAPSATQHSENLSRLKARKSDYDGLLLGEEILALRRRYGITQQAAAKIFGKGKIAFSRYENESSYPDETATKLLGLAIKNADVIKALADEAGVMLPLWSVRCDDQRKVTPLLISCVEMTTEKKSAWVSGFLPAFSLYGAARAHSCKSSLREFSARVEMPTVRKVMLNQLGEAY